MASNSTPPDMTSLLESLSPEDRINTVLAIGEGTPKRLTAQFVEQECKLKSFSRESETTAKATYTFTVSHLYCNGSGNLHGGAQSLIYDICTSLTLQAIAKRGGWLNGGVSRVLTVTYLRPASEGTELELETEVVAAGKSLAMLRGVLRQVKDGKPISTCEHNKAHVPTKPNWKL